MFHVEHVDLIKHTRKQNLIFHAVNNIYPYKRYAFTINLIPSPLEREGILIID